MPPATYAFWCRPKLVSERLNCIGQMNFWLMLTPNKTNCPRIYVYLLLLLCMYGLHKYKTYSIMPKVTANQNSMNRGRHVPSFIAWRLHFDGRKKNRQFVLHAILYEGILSSSCVQISFKKEFLCVLRLPASLAITH